MDEERATGFWRLLGIALRSHIRIRNRFDGKGVAKPTLTNYCCNSSVSGGVCTTVLLPYGAWLATVTRRSRGSSWHGRIPNVVGTDSPSVNTNSDPSTIHCYACAGQICVIRSSAEASHIWVSLKRCAVEDCGPCLKKTSRHRWQLPGWSSVLA